MQIRGLSTTKKKHLCRVNGVSTLYKYKRLLLQKKNKKHKWCRACCSKKPSGEFRFRGEHSPPRGLKIVLKNTIICFFSTISWCRVGWNSCAKSRAPLCHAANRPSCLGSTQEPDMFLGVALVCPAFHNLREETCKRNYVLLFSANNDSGCWCPLVSCPCGRCQQLIPSREPWLPIFCSPNLTSEITPTYGVNKMLPHCGV